MTTDHPQYRAQEVCDEMDHIALINLADWCGSSSKTHDAAMGSPFSGSVHSTGNVNARDADIIYSALKSAQFLGVGGQVTTSKTFEPEV